MRRWMFLCVFVLALIAPARAEAQPVDLFLIPLEVTGTHRSPKYFCKIGPPIPPCISSGFNLMDYGFVNWALLLAPNLSAEDRLMLQSAEDVFTFPENLDGPVDQEVQPFFEDIHLPTDWLVPATTWRELLRQVAGMFTFNQRFAWIAAAETGEVHSIFDNANLDTRLRQMTADEITWFLMTVESFGFDPAVVSLNSQLRQLVRQAGDFWEDQPFHLGSWEF